MALTDIHFQTGEGQDFLLEIPVGTLFSPIDILFEPSGGQYLVMELVLSGGGGNIFIMSE